MRTIDEINAEIQALVGEAVKVAEATGEKVVIDMGLGAVTVPWMHHESAYYHGVSLYPEDTLDEEVYEAMPAHLQYPSEEYDAEFKRIKQSLIGAGRLQELEAEMIEGLSAHGHQTPTNVEYTPGCGWMFADVWMPSSANC